uniref:Uncharacterized protein n=1 Tax=Rhizophora mucronata TaxID=61149 RepID=A0A2P2L0C1_RHIMU
MRHNFTSPLQD